MKIVSPLLKHVLYPALAKAGVLRRTAAAGLAVVTYHGIIPAGYEPVDSTLDSSLVSAQTLRRQLSLLKRNYNVVSPEDVLLWCEGGRELPSRAVLLTCDDGLLNNLTDMLPILQEEGLRCLFFVTGASAGDARTTLWYEELFLVLLRAPAGPVVVSSKGLEIGGTLGTREQRRAMWWDTVKRLSELDSESRNAFVRAAKLRYASTDATAPEELVQSDDSTLERRFTLLTRSNLVQLSSAGMTVGSHTLSHPMLSRSPAELARAEIRESRIRLEAALGKRVWAFAYPFGDAQSVTPQVLTMARDAGYQAAFLNIGGGLGTELTRHAMPRIHVTAEMSLAEFEAHVAGLHALLQRRAGRTHRGLGAALN